MSGRSQRERGDAAGFAPVLEAATAILGSARHLLVLTGSGISAESGVPTFRGAGGYWRNHSAQELATPEAFRRDPRLVWDWYLERRRTVRDCEPNAAHRSLAAWSALPRGTLITQNVDGLHERAGHRGVIRFHGSLWRNRCARCGAERDVEDLDYPTLPVSPCCAAPERPGVVWFGEAIPPPALAAAAEALGRADVVLVVGTSGVVYPAAGLIDEARARDARVVEVNPEPSGIVADVVIAMPAGEAVPQILPLG